MLRKRQDSSQPNQVLTNESIQIADGLRQTVFVNPDKCKSRMVAPPYSSKSFHVCRSSPFRRWFQHGADTPDCRPITARYDGDSPMITTFSTAIAHARSISNPVPLSAKTLSRTRILCVRWIRNPHPSLRYTRRLEKTASLSGKYPGV